MSTILWQQMATKVNSTQIGFVILQTVVYGVLRVLEHDTRESTTLL